MLLCICEQSFQNGMYTNILKITLTHERRLTMSKFCPYCYSEIDSYATKCPYCCSEIPIYHNSNRDASETWIYIGLTVALIISIIIGIKTSSLMLGIIIFLIGIVITTFLACCIE